ncbi:MAG TPA: HlyD family type I secretion periplasmic adaptor subunit [Caulobacteraceae bacterium]|jgi:HlyD family secretion protein|nr:HlyD family type I secretion periplasmic adaptor subunit [Caulobacteraceae bacterium]
MNQRADPSQFEPFLKRLVAGGDEDLDLDGSPHRDIVRGLVVLGAFLVIFLGWGLFARLDSGVYAPGTVVVYGNRQSVQHKDGGIVADLKVHEGDRVRSGQVLLRLAADELEANERATADQVYQLEALRARLMAEMTGQPTIAPPPEFAGLADSDKASADNALLIEQRQFASRAADLGAQKAILRQRENQLSEEIAGYRHQVVSNGKQQVLVDQEMDSLKDLQQRGLVPMARIRSLQRDAAQLTGTSGEYNATIAKTEQQIGETRLQASELDRQRIAETSKDYGDVQMQLAVAQPKLMDIRRQLERATVRAPVTGRVVGLSIFTVGGVVAPGQKLMDIVPEGEPLVIDARIQPNDAEDLKVGQTLEIRIPAFHDRRMPTLNGTISRISADSLVDEKSGASFFIAEITVPRSQLRLIHDVRGAEAGLKPGLPVEVVVPLRHRTALSYLIDPLRGMLWKSFRER